MRAIRLILCALTLPLANCATSPQQSETLGGDRQRMADCIYQRLSPEIGPGLIKTDVPTSNLSRLALESGGVRYWDLTISAVGPGQSHVEFVPSRNMWGSDAGGAQNVWTAVTACSRP